MAANPMDLAGQRQRREGAIRATFAASVAVRVFSAVCSLAQVPLALGLLGGEAFGFWITLTSTALLLNASDLGLGLAMQNQVAEALGRDRAQRTPAILLTTFIGLAGVGAAMLAAGLVVTELVDWARLFHLTEPALVADATNGARAALLLFSLGLPLTAAARLASACQWGWLAAIWNAVGVAGQLLVIACAGRLGLSFAGFVFLTGAPLLLANAGLLLHTAQRLRWRLGDLSFATAEERRTLLHRSWEFCLPQVSAAFIYNSAAPMISLVAGAPAVTAYNVAQRLFGLFGQLQQMMLSPLWPAYTEAQARGDMGWINTSYRRSLTGTVLGICLPLLLAASALPWIVDRWTGPGTVDLPPSLVWLLCAWNVLLALSNAPAFLLGGLGRMRRLGRGSFVGSLLMAAGMVWLGERWGAEGVIAALVAGYLLLLLPVTFHEAGQALHTDAALPRRNRLPGLARRAVIPLLSGPPRGRHDRRFALAIYKVDRLGDFVLALGAIRTLLNHHGADRCLLVISAVAEPLATAEFPHTPRLVLPVTAGGILRNLVPTTWRHRRQFAAISCDTIVCLRHQREAYHEVSLSWLAADRCLKLEPGDYPAIDPEHARSAELEAHRQIVGRALGREIGAEELVSGFTSFTATEGNGLLVCPFSIDPVRDIPPAILLAALLEWCGHHPGSVEFSGSPADAARLTALATEARAGGLADVRVVLPADQLGFVRQVLAARIVLTADSAGAHIATAFDKPTVVVQGGAFAGVFGPWHRSARQRWLQHALPCFGCASHCTEPENYCLTRLPPHQIVDALNEVSR